ncbi:hypothetical protein EV421DRAFT_1908490 [Armillaria borealis]|uniref:Uncharacterized protein n=1 Tax=Armillaria borealis TaxID=47425 RepID=A0AA39J3T3_9AGAR|nr:hypothetical protein EV421DRAFT_1908490 [Armillaria borealis]
MYSTRSLPIPLIAMNLIGAIYGTLCVPSYLSTSHCILIFAEFIFVMCRRRQVMNVYIRCGHTINLPDEVMRAAQLQVQSFSSSKLQTTCLLADLLAIPSLS